MLLLNSTLQNPISFDISNYSYEKWYPIFEHVCFRSEMLELPQDFVQYLLEDGFFVDEASFPTPEKEDRYDEGEEKWPDEEDQIPNFRKFPELESQVEESIRRMGAIYPKLNWSSPKDAIWMTTFGKLKCEKAREVFLLLKSSDVVADQITKILESKGNVTLVLRKWYDLKPSFEFRCFVKDNQILGISQRDLNYYPHLKESSTTIEQKIIEFFETHIKGKFFDPTFIFDVYVASNLKKVVLMDFSPWSEEIDSLLFDWDELHLMPDGKKEPLLDFRVITSQGGIVPSQKMRTMLPYDLVDISEGSALSEMIEKIKQMQTEEQ